MTRRVAFASLLLGIGVLAACGDDEGPFQNQRDTDLSLLHDHDPESERRSFTLLPGFEVNLFAAEPMLANPVAMTWDERGRLWVACSWSYPQLRPGEAADDQIIILEDTDGDGRADRHTVFADGLYIPTGFELSADGVYVAQAPDLLRLRDTDGDDRADVREIVLTGFGIEDSHHSISAFRRGPDGWIYFHEGLFLHSQIETAFGNVHLDDGGVYRFRPGREELQVFADLRVGNPWGHLFDRDGQSVLVDNGRLSFLAPATANSRAKLDYAPMLKTDKQCGGDFVQSPHFPDAMQGQLLTCWYKSHTIIRYSVAPQGAGMSAALEEPLLRAKHPNFRPVDCRFGPDGALYVADWYNPIINHSQHDFRDPRRDTEHGRIWRITCTGRPLQEPLCAGAPDAVTTAALLEELHSEDAWRRDKVRLALTRRDPPGTAEAIRRWVAGAAAANRERTLREGLWALQSIGVPDPAMLREALSARAPSVRATGLRILRDWRAEFPDLLALLDAGIRDPEPRVRLEAALTLSFVPDAEALPVLLQLLDQPRDHFLEHALTLAMDALQPYWVPALQAGTLRFRDPAHRARAISASPVDLAAGLEELLASRVIDLQAVQRLLDRLTTAGQQNDADVVLGQALGPRLPGPAARVLFLQALEQAARQRGLLPTNHLRAGVLRFLPAGQPLELRVAAVQLLGAWKFGEAGQSLTTLARDAETPPALRRAAFETIGEIGGDDSRRFLQGFAADGDDWETRALGVFGLAADDVNAAAEAAANLFEVDPGDHDPVALFTALTSRVGGAAALAAALDRHAPDDRVRAELVRAMRRTGLPDAALRQALRDDTASLAEQLLEESVEVLATAARDHGDPVRGERLFRSAALACTSCHALAGAGPTLGPDLTSLGAAATPERIVDSILRPSLALAEEYECVAVITEDDRVISGTLQSQSERELVLRDAARSGDPVVIPRARIRELRATASLMPEGLADGLPDRQAFLDLVSFLTELGRPGPMRVDVQPVVRTWRWLRLDAAPDGPQDWDAASPWVPAYSRLDGELPLQELGRGPWFALRFWIEVTQPGRMTLEVSGPPLAGLWVRGQPCPTPDRISVEAGRSDFVMVVPAAADEGTLHARITTDGEAAARLQPVAGR